MPTTPAIIARNQRILAGHAAGATVRDLALAEAVDPAVVRRVLRAAGTPIPGRPALDAEVPAALVDPAWLRAEYATKAEAGVTVPTFLGDQMDESVCQFVGADHWSTDV